MAAWQHEGVWREPPTETTDYPGLTVNDARVNGSINIRDSRLSLWAIVGTAVTLGWGEVEQQWSPSRYDYAAHELAMFLGCLLEQRGEFARLLCVLADVERRQERSWTGPPWWERKTSRRRVLRALRACVAALERAEGDHAPR